MYKNNRNDTIESGNMNIYEYQRPLGKITDIPELRDKFIAIYETKSHQDVVRFCLIFGQHLINMTGFSLTDEIEAGFEGMQQWLEGKTNYHEARNASFVIGRTARAEKDPVKARFYRTMAQITASPHVKYHGLWATDFAVTLVNKLHPDNINEVRKERKKQIELVESV